MKVFVVHITAKLPLDSPRRLEGRFVAETMSEAFILAARALPKGQEMTLISICESSEPPLREMPSIAND